MKNLRIPKTLKKLQLNNNKFSGKISPVFHSLEELDLADNDFNGVFPFDLQDRQFEYCNLKGNDICGGLLYSGNCGELIACLPRPIKTEDDLAIFGLKITERIKSDGNCQFSALASEINRVKPDWEELTQEELRLRAAHYIRDQNKLATLDYDQVQIFHHWDEEVF